MSEAQATRRIPTLVMVVFPLILLGGLLWLLAAYDPTRVFQASFPPIEELTIQRLILSSDGITAQVFNGGPEPVTISQVQVDEAYWDHQIKPGRTLPRLGYATIFIPYPWVEGETHIVKVVTRNGLTFEKDIPVAFETPTPSAHFFKTFTLLGVYVGVIPVILGLFWFPALKRATDRWMDFVLFLTIGLLIFLGVEAIEEGMETSEKLPGVYQGIALLVFGTLGTYVFLQALHHYFLAKRKEDATLSQLTVAYMVALGIGLHNLGEGLAIGAAYTLGNISLGTMLVVGFMLHNTTEGLAIVAPVSKATVGLKHLVLMGALAGVPTIFGAWLGGFTYSDALALLFLSIGAGAIFQVVYQIAGQLAARRGGLSALFNFVNVSGLAAGFLIMYATGLMVAV